MIGTSFDVEFLTLDDIGFKNEIIEDGKTFKENSLIKAKAVSKFTDLPVLSDDSGIIIDELGENFPGIYSHRYADENGGQEALNNRLIKEIPGSKARFICVITFINSGKISQFEGVFEGKISNTIQKLNGFGYDPIFIPEGYDKSASMLSEQEKNAISHRGKAFRKFIEYLKTI